MSSNKLLKINKLQMKIIFKKLILKFKKRKKYALITLFFNYKKQYICAIKKKKK